jgi:hypothetical protein
MLMRQSQFAVFGLAVAVLVAGQVAQRAVACPFCAGVEATLTEEVGQSNVAVIARVAYVPELAANTTFSSLDSLKAKFEVVEVLKGEKALGGAKKFEAVYFGDSPVGTNMLMLGQGELPDISWAMPIVVGQHGREYLGKALKAAKGGADRLAFFQDYLEDKDSVLSRDAFNEFGNAPYSAVKDLKPRMKREQLLTWIKDPQVQPLRRRLYLTMLGVCGTPEDGQALGAMLKSPDRASKAGLDALIAAYLTLTGPEGVTLVEDLYLKNLDALYADVHAAVMALRFHGQEDKVVSRERLIHAMRIMLTRKQHADLVIPDLARWQDWGSMDQMVKLFKESDENSDWVRTPVIQYLQACPLPMAKKHLAELAKLDPDAAKRANSFFPFGTAPVPTSKDRTPKESQIPAPAGETNKSAANRSIPQNRQAGRISATYNESLGQPGLVWLMSSLST